MPDEDPATYAAKLKAKSDIETQGMKKLMAMTGDQSVVGSGYAKGGVVRKSKPKSRPKSKKR
jgi:hypothetical protein